MTPDISRHFQPNETDREIGMRIVELDKTPQAIVYFSEQCHRLTDYGYWFYLSTLWVSYTGWSDLQLWRQLFGSDRPHRNECIMKPSEFIAWCNMPKMITVYRSHRPGETDWLSYTTDLRAAGRFATQRGVRAIHQYTMDKRHVLAYFLRRGESEVLTLTREAVKLVKVIGEQR